MNNWGDWNLNVLGCLSDTPRLMLLIGGYNSVIPLYVVVYKLFLTRLLTFILKYDTIFVLTTKTNTNKDKDKTN